MTIRLSAFRLYLLRASYLLLVIGLGATLWPAMFQPPAAWQWALTHGALNPPAIGLSPEAHTTPISVGIVVCMLGSLCALAVLGLRYPLQMLPLLFWEVTWKSIWLLAVALPLWVTHRMDDTTAQTMIQCLMAVIFVIAIPWRYVYANYVKKAGDPWGSYGTHPTSTRNVPVRDV